jgi:hypothetical protein
MKSLIVATSLTLVLAGTVSATENSQPKLAEGSRFVTCIDGKALYTDAYKNLYQIPDEAHCGAN